MKNKINRSVLYPIRAVLLLLVCSLLLTGCSIDPWKAFERKEFYTQWFLGDTGACGAVKSETSCFDLDNVNLQCHFGISQRVKYLEKLHSGYYEAVIMCFMVIDENDQHVLHVAEKLDAQDERLEKCLCGSKNHNEIWFSYTVPKDLLLQGAKDGRLFWRVYGIVSDTAEEKEEFLASLPFCYRIRDSKVYFGDSDSDFLDYPPDGSGVNYYEA